MRGSGVLSASTLKKKMGGDDSTTLFFPPNSFFQSYMREGARLFVVGDNRNKNGREAPRDLKIGAEDNSGQQKPPIVIPTTRGRKKRNMFLRFRPFQLLLLLRRRWPNPNVEKEDRSTPSSSTKSPFFRHARFPPERNGTSSSNDDSNRRWKRRSSSFGSSPVGSEKGEEGFMKKLYF